ncbi:hypothetical protein AWM75_02475 [Aerococcus urinaehominis]|uniref:Glucose-6-phosphate 1-dehydrogenase n=1 Tax=Aerococcus urinaehominis TaxID=128944 RepID=A0A0X8FKC9_9LACT|nr:glucose-6-phosphate dehydrogenase [Aerococcus urinaehominis]AMB98928.1 hypothetical protein AWM75_02475 [Aerococcus urinaehominis]SDM39982.1 glucose-6-phosphate 1-dehydrogenase [Aerococcus urinaehominis]
MKQANQLDALFILFGATGDLAKRMLYPALFRLYLRGILKEHFAIIGTARRPWDNEVLREVVFESVQNECDDPETIKDFASHFYYLANDATKIENFSALNQLMGQLKQAYQIGDRHFYYLSVSPSLFADISNNLKKSGIVDQPGIHRLILEKPFGHNQASALALNQDLNISFSEDQIYRIDHYLGKETVLNILASRYYNPFLEAIWNRDHIKNIQVTLSEDMPVGSRGGYYDHSGAIRDMFQNHILQIIALLGMDLPQELKPQSILTNRQAFFKSLSSLSPDQVADQIVRGQYGANPDLGIPDYLDEDQVAVNSVTETYIAGQLLSDLPRWQDVPFYFRTGKAMTQKYTTVDIIFKSHPSQSDQPNRLTFYISPELGVSLQIQQKTYSDQMLTEPACLQMTKPVSGYLATAYEKLIHDVLKGDQTNFTSFEELLDQWRIVDHITEAWETLPAPDFPNYQAGSLGPQAADDLLARNNDFWINHQFS